MGSALCRALVEGIPWDGRGWGIPLKAGLPRERRGGRLEFCTGDKGLTIYHNVFAAIPLRVEVFSGIADQQFTLGKKQPGEFDSWQEITSPV
jgi:hypothetical protein